MNEIFNKFEQLINEVSTYVATSSEKGNKIKPAPDKWSKKEILGHLIDSGIYNLQRFTEIQFKPKPYKITTYNQDELVEVNKYNELKTSELLNFWLNLNRRIVHNLEGVDSKILAYPIVLPNGELSDFKFLIEDYLVHLEHHLKQLKH